MPLAIASKWCSDSRPHSARCSRRPEVSGQQRQERVEVVLVEERSSGSPGPRDRCSWRAMIRWTASMAPVAMVLRMCHRCACRNSSSPDASAILLQLDARCQSSALRSRAPTTTACGHRAPGQGRHDHRVAGPSPPPASSTPAIAAPTVGPRFRVRRPACSWDSRANAMARIGPSCGGRRVERLREKSGRLSSLGRTVRVRRRAAQADDGSGALRRPCGAPASAACVRHSSAWRWTPARASAPANAHEHVHRVPGSLGPKRSNTSRARV